MKIEINTFVIISSDLDIISLTLFDCKRKILNSKENSKMADLLFFQNVSSQLLEFLLYLFLLSCEILPRGGQTSKLCQGVQKTATCSAGMHLSLHQWANPYLFSHIFQNQRLPPLMYESQMKMCSFHVIIIHGLAHCHWLMVRSCLWQCTVQNFMSLHESKFSIINFNFLNLCTNEVGC